MHCTLKHKEYFVRLRGWSVAEAREDMVNGRESPVVSRLMRRDGAVAIVARKEKGANRRFAP